MNDTHVDPTGMGLVFIVAWFFVWIELMWLLTGWQTGELYLLGCGLVWAIPTAVCCDSLVWGVRQLASAR